MVKKEAERSSSASARQRPSTTTLSVKGVGVLSSSRSSNQQRLRHHNPNLFGGCHRTNNLLSITKELPAAVDGVGLPSDIYHYLFHRYQLPESVY